ncbi:ribosomal oxygenase 1 [Euwallacea fornicatus]|uniref:ribosomal oxygenase 1 n=1 Tax=Euwallacea fornicatus TaxID=995702 RepID=UPI0033906CB1
MDGMLSAFQIYQKQNKQKKKLSVKQEPLPAKVLKRKKRAKNLKKEPPKGLSPKCEIPKKKLKKSSPKVVKNSLKIKKVSSSSEDEIPTLVPINEPKHSKLSNGNINIKKKPKISPPEKHSVGFNPLTHSLAIFKWLINPLEVKNFFTKNWEKDVLHIKRSDPTYYSQIFSSVRLDQILRECSLHFSRNIDVVTYQNNKKEVIEEEGRALPSTLWDYYNNGCSIRVLNPHTYDHNVHSLISSLQEYFGTMVGTNVYLTPPDSQGFAPHFDDIEAFIVQLEGTKYWKLYKPKNEDVLARDSSKNFSHDELGAPFMEVELKAGDLMYFPRGTIHEGRTKDEHSLHITISMYQHTAYADLLEQAIPAALKKAATENVEFRKGLPLNYLKHIGLVNKNDKSARRKIILDKVKTLLTSLVDYLDVDLAADNLGRKFMHDAMPPLYSKEEAQFTCKYDGDFMKNGKVFNRIEISPEVRLRLLRYYALRVVQESSKTSKIYFCTDNAKTYHGEEEQWLEIDNSLIPGIEALQKSYPEFIEVNSLPIKDEIEKLGLVSSLWEHGLVVTEGPLPSFASDDESEREEIESESD